MPGNEEELQQIRGAIIEGRRGTPATPTRVTPGRNVNATSRRTPKIGPKMTLKDESDLSDFIEADYNPTIWPFNKTIEFNDKNRIGGDDAIEFKGIKKQEFTIQLFFTDFGYHGRKQSFKDSVDWKLQWLDNKSNPGLVFDEERQAFNDTPTILFIERGVNVQRAVITKIEGKIELFSSLWIPLRARVNVTFRNVIRPRDRSKR